MSNQTRRDAASLSLSVVIPAYNAAAHLEQCLSALSRSTCSPHEIIVVDDGSTDASCQVAQRHGARVVALDGNRGPAYARNRGAQAAEGDVLVFIDADVCVHEDTLARIAAAFAQDPDLSALMGSYDDRPGDHSFLSQYKNLFHHYVHQRGRSQASTFWSGLGAVRRSTFLDLGGFNEGYDKACIEDIELGFRLHQSGHRIRLEKGIQATHLKQWRLGQLVRTDLWLRGVPWVALMLRDRRMVRDLNLSWHARVCTFLTYLLVAVVLALVATGHGTATLAALGATGVGVIAARLYDHLGQAVWRWVPPAGLAALLPALWVVDGLGPLMLLPLIVLLAILGIHSDFYRFWVRARGFSFAVAVVPFHLLFFLYSGLAIPLGILAHIQDQRRARRWATGPATTPARPLQPFVSPGASSPARPGRVHQT